MERGIRPRDGLCLWKPCIYEWLTHYFTVPSGLIYTRFWLRNKGLSFAMKMHMKTNLPWWWTRSNGDLGSLLFKELFQAALVGDQFNINDFFCKWSRSQLELIIHRLWTRGWHKPDYFKYSLDIIKTSVVGRNVLGRDILISCGLFFKNSGSYLWSLWIQRPVFWRPYWESRCLRFGLTTPHYHMGQRGFRAHESMWSGTAPQAAAVAFLLAKNVSTAVSDSTTC